MRLKVKTESPPQKKRSLERFFLTFKKATQQESISTAIEKLHTEIGNSKLTGPQLTLAYLYHDLLLKSDPKKSLSTADESYDNLLAFIASEISYEIDPYYHTVLLEIYVYISQANEFQKEFKEPKESSADSKQEVDKLLSPKFKTIYSPEFFIQNFLFQAAKIYNKVLTLTKDCSSLENLKIFLQGLDKGVLDFLMVINIIIGKRFCDESNQCLFLKDFIVEDLKSIEKSIIFARHTPQSEDEKPTLSIGRTRHYERQDAKEKDDIISYTNHRSHHNLNEILLSAQQEYQQQIKLKGVRQSLISLQNFIRIEDNNGTVKELKKSTSFKKCLSYTILPPDEESIDCSFDEKERDEPDVVRKKLEFHEAPLVPLSSTYNEEEWSLIQSTIELLQAKDPALSNHDQNSFCLVMGYIIGGVGSWRTDKNKISLKELIAAKFIISVAIQSKGSYIGKTTLIRYKEAFYDYFLMELSLDPKDDNYPLLKKYCYVLIQNAYRTAGRKNEKAIHLAADRLTYFLNLTLNGKKLSQIVKEKSMTDADIISRINLQNRLVNQISLQTIRSPHQLAQMIRNSFVGDDEFDKGNAKFWLSLYTRTNTFWTMWGSTTSRASTELLEKPILKVDKVSASAG